MFGGSTLPFFGSISFNESCSAVDLQEILDRGRDVEVQRGRVVEISRPRMIRRKRRDRRCVAMSFALSGENAWRHCNDWPVQIVLTGFRQEDPELFVNLCELRI